jgi:hypothetical protein
MLFLATGTGLGSATVSSSEESSALVGELLLLADARPNRLVLVGLLVLLVDAADGSAVPARLRNIATCFFKQTAALSDLPGERIADA